MTTTDPLTLARDDLDFIRQHLATARRRLEDQRRGQPGSALGGGGGRGGGSPVETALGLGGPDREDVDERFQLHGDRAAHQLAHLEALTKQATRTLHLLRLIVEAEVPKAPTDKQRREVERANTEDPTCQHCTPHRPPGKTELVHRTGDVAGNLPEPMALCRWCYDAVRRSGQLPSKQAIGRHTLDLKPLRVHVSG